MQGRAMAENLEQNSWYQNDYSNLPYFESNKLYMYRLSNNLELMWVQLL